MSKKSVRVLVTTLVLAGAFVGLMAVTMRDEAMTYKRVDEVVPVASLMGIALALLAFFEIADEVDEGDARSFDESVLLALRTSDPADPVGPRWLETSVVDISALGGFADL